MKSRFKSKQLKKHIERYRSLTLLTCAYNKRRKPEDFLNFEYLGSRFVFSIDGPKHEYKGVHERGLIPGACVPTVWPTTQPLLRRTAQHCFCKWQGLHSSI